MRVRVLDGLRGYAALSIVLAHMPQITDSVISEFITHFVALFHLHYVGVDIFFVLSGFLITRILIREKERNEFSFRTFYVKRALRIFPIYYLTLIVCGLLFSWDGIEYTATYLSNYYFSFYELPDPLRHTWSLAVEEHYYLIWPVVIYYISPEKIRKYFLPVVLAIVLISMIHAYAFLETYLADNLVDRATNFRILSIAIGSMFALHESRLVRVAHERWGSLLVAFIAVYGLALYLNLSPLVEHIPAPAINLFLFTGWSSLLFVLVLGLEGRSGPLNFLFTNRLIRFTGAISYAIYLFHFPIFYYFEITHNQLLDNSVEFTELVMPLLLTFLLPVVSFYLIERPVGKLRGVLIGSS